MAEPLERILTGWVAELAVTFYRGCEVTGLAQDGTGVGLHPKDGRTLRGDHVVGCDGGQEHVAWVGGGSDAGLREALGRWFGPAMPRASVPSP
ncbi:FAD-dependent monooxygenase [Arthrobacter sp. AB6]|uniref:FAD-dependent monooxygenase n=1 Tax=Arthrobacter sp. AB6 TaxID=2962570 RepID=UPI0028826DDF|nr:FAD-dependent monooxygenase [Arthrobacter sp. AB6]MDT0197207.1 FAD-dependent monooxygenase [Arthrobacter sp. AB6]